MIKNIKQDGCISLDEVIEIAKNSWPISMVKDLSGIVKEILRTCVSVGCTVGLYYQTCGLRFKRCKPCCSSRKHGAPLVSSVLDLGGFHLVRMSITVTCY
ncbi:hypothetical protein RJ639_035103 [Escallonia herrerae]|uniref:Large ribosomal subunit protein uL11 C-terminal domain-containing protein n=1 Tax=Escallonia herrerae TaxID=1293975 RepID=A0AA88WPI1_9ASTE|nr:hypothetical protein RJ639_035103 [Escallonia herrerae]